MKTTAIICEFNPLHTGHKKLIDYAKTFSDKVICIMSGNFTQRGMPAVCDKYSRAKHAIIAGADIVAELPLPFSIASAENFAYGGVAVANALKADYLLFGSECGDIDRLKTCAEMLLDDEVNGKIASEVKKGVSYPKAVSCAVGTDVLDKPNNVLAVEYLKALILSKSTVVPVTLMREDNYNGEAGDYASSKSLRESKPLRNKFGFDYVNADIDDEIEQRYFNFAASLTALKTCEEMRKIEGVNEGLENRIFDADKSHGLEKMLDEIKTKRYTRLRLQRIVLNTVLNVTKQDVITAKNNTVNVKALAVKKESTSLLALTNDGPCDELTARADRLYYSLTDAKPPRKLVKID